MEDFTPLLWIVFAVGALIYSSATQAARRKKAEKEAQMPQHGEAWPSWDASSESEEEQPNRQTPYDSQPEHPEATVYEKNPGMPQTPTYSEEIFGEDSAPSFDAESTYEAEISLETDNHGHTSHSIRTKQDKQTGYNPANGSSPAVKPANNTENLSAKSHTIANDTPSTEEEFDLRRAIIYSEILKPKFDK